MTKQEYISHKIRILEHENKGRSHAQNVAIAISLANKKYGMQQGGEWWNTFTNPNFDIQAQTMSPQQNFAPQTTGMNAQGSLGQPRPQLEPLTQITPQGLQPFTTPPVQGLTTPDLSKVQQSYIQSQPKDFTWESTQKNTHPTGDEWQRYKLANICRETTKKRRK